MVVLYCTYMVEVDYRNKNTLNLQIYGAKVAQKPPLSSINSLESDGGFGALEKF